MLTLEQAAYRVSTRGGDDEEVFIDPITIMLICSILSTVFSLLRLWCQWRQGKEKATEQDGVEIQEVCQRAPRRIRRKIRAIVAEKLGPEKNAHYGNNLVSCILSAGAATSPAEIAATINGTYENRFGQTETEL